MSSHHCIAILLLLSLDVASCWHGSTFLRMRCSHATRCTQLLGSLKSNVILGPLADAARRAAELSTGKGTESSGTGRPEWGTWCDTELFDEVRDLCNRVAFSSKEDGVWPGLWAIAGGEAAAGTIRLASGKQHDVLLHLFASPAGVPADDRNRQAKYADGVLTLLRPLVGSVRIEKLRPSGDTIGVPKDLRAGLPKETSSRAFLQMGGPQQRYLATTSTAALLEVVLRHDTQASTLSPDLPTLSDADASALLLGAFRDLEAPTVPETAAPAAQGGEPAAASGDALNDGGDGTSTGKAAERKAALESSLKTSVGGLEAQLEAIVRRVLASRADPEAARRLGVSHVRGILLSGPPGCGKTLLARELARSLGAREPQVVNGPEILDKYVGEAEKRVRELFAPAEAEWEAAGDASELHVIVLDEMDAIARKRGAADGDTSGVRDSVVNQLLAKMDGVNELSNVLVIGLTNRPELLDEALLRPGRLEVKLEVSLPDVQGRRDILRIHTRAMRANGALSEDAECYIDADGAACSLDAAEASPSLAEATEHFSGAELAGLVRSAASYALGRAAVGGGKAMVSRDDLQAALLEVRPARGRRDEAMAARFEPHGMGMALFEKARARLRRLLVLPSQASAVRSALLVPEAAAAGADASCLAAWAGCLGGPVGDLDYVRFVSVAELLSDGGGASEDARSRALAERFIEARSMRRSMLILDDLDLLLSSPGAPGSLSAVLLGALRSQLKEPLASPSRSSLRGGADGGGGGGGGGDSASGAQPAPCLVVVATVSDPAVASELSGVFESLIKVPMLHTAEEAADALRSSIALGLDGSVVDAAAAAAVAGGPVGARQLLGLATQACAMAEAEGADGSNTPSPEAQLEALNELLMW